MNSFKVHYLRVKILTMDKDSTDEEIRCCKEPTGFLDSHSLCLYGPDSFCLGLMPPYFIVVVKTRSALIAKSSNICRGYGEDPHLSSDYARRENSGLSTATIVQHLVTAGCCGHQSYYYWW